MANIHLRATRDGLTEVVYHILVPGENNTAGMALKDAIVAAGHNITRLSVGKTGELTQTEANAITAGTVFEISDSLLIVQWFAEGGYSLVTSKLDTLFAQRQASTVDLIRSTYTAFGYTR